MLHPDAVGESLFFSGAEKQLANQILGLAYDMGGLF